MTITPGLPSHEEPSGLPARRLAAVTALYLALAVVFTWPLALRLTTHVPGELCSDIWRKLWGYYFVHRGLLESHAFPVSTQLINAPYGGALFITDPLDALLAAPLLQFFSLGVSHNLLVIFHLLLAATGAFLLARYLTGNSLSSWISGVVFAFSPYVLAYCIGSGVMEMLNIGWIPFTLLYFFRTVKEKRLVNPLLAGIFLALTALGTWYYAIFTALFLTLFLLYLLVCGKAYPLHDRGAAARLTWKDFTRTVAAVLLAALLVSPAAIAFRSASASPDSLLGADKIEMRNESNLSFYLGANFHSAAFLSEYFLSGKSNLGVVRMVDTIYHTSYLGYGALFLALLALCAPATRRAPLVVFLWTLSLLFIVISLGPFVFITRELHATSPANLPYMLLYRFFPFFSSLGAPYRLYPFISLFIALLAAMGLSVALQRIRHLHLLTALLAGLLVFCEILVLSPARYPISMAPAAYPSCYRALAEKGSRGALLDLPMLYRGGPAWLPIYFYYQSLHGRPVPYTICDWHGPLPRYFNENAFLTRLHLLEDTERGRLNPSPEEKEVRRGARSLAASGITQIVVHRRFYAPETERKVVPLLTSFYGEPQALDEETLLFTLPAGARAPLSGSAPFPAARESLGAPGYPTPAAAGSPDAPEPPPLSEFYESRGGHPPVITRYPAPAEGEGKR